MGKRNAQITVLCVASKVTLAIDINPETLGEIEWELGHGEHHFHPYYIHQHSIMWLPPHVRGLRNVILG